MNDFIAKLRGYIYRGIYLRFMPNVSIQENLKIYKKLKIIGDGKVFIGKNFIAGNLVGENNKYVTIDTHSPDATIIIGDNVKLFSTRVSSFHKIEIEDNVIIEDSGVVDTDFHSIEKHRGDPVHETLDQCKIFIGNNVVIGASSIITKGASIESGSVVLPGSVVSKPINKKAIIAGNPARPI